MSKAIGDSPSRFIEFNYNNGKREMYSPDKTTPNDSSGNTFFNTSPEKIAEALENKVAWFVYSSFDEGEVEYVINGHEIKSIRRKY